MKAADNHSAITGSNNPGDRRALIVSHNFPPSQGAESLLVRNNAVYLHHLGWRVSVLTAPERLVRLKQDMGLMRGIPDEIDIIRTEHEGALIQPGMGKFLRASLGVVESRILPCCRLLWQKEATELGMRWIARNGPAIIYSRAPRHVSNTTARELKRRSGLPWVAHFSDPWYDWRYMGIIHRVLSRILEYRVISDADSIVFVNQPLADKVMAKYPNGWRCKVQVIPHGFASFPENDAGAAKRTESGPLRILHTGSFYPGLRTPNGLFRGMALLNQRLPLEGRLSLECVGEETTLFQTLVTSLGLGHVVKLRESVPYDECQRMIGAADLLLVVDVTKGLRGVFLPTKLIEYFAFRKPVLGIAPPNSAVAQTLAYCGLQCADQDDPTAIASALERQIAAWETGSFDPNQTTRDRMAGYHIDVVNKPLNDLFNSLLAGAS